MVRVGAEMVFYTHKKRPVFGSHNETSMRTIAIPKERSLHITEGVAKHAKTSSVQAKCVR